MTATPQEIQAFAADSLADFKVPRQVVIVPKIPSEATGKQKRIALAAALGLVDAPGADAERTPFVAPRTPTEEIIAGVFAQILGPSAGASGQPIGIHDNFFRLGGESLMAVRVLGKIRQVLKVGLKVQDFFLGPTVADLARSVEAQQAARRKDAAVSPSRAWPRARRRRCPSCKRVCGSSISSSPPTPRTTSTAPRASRGRWIWMCSSARFKRSFGGTTSSGPRSPPEPGADVVSSRPNSSSLFHGSTFAACRPPSGRQRPSGSPWRRRERHSIWRRAAAANHAVLLGPDEHMLLARGPPHRHRSLVDRRPVSRARRAVRRLRQGRAVGLPELPIQHSDFAAWQVQGRPQLEQQVAYWKQQLADLPPGCRCPRIGPVPPPAIPGGRVVLRAASGPVEGARRAQPEGGRDALHDPARRLRRAAREGLRAAGRRRRLSHRQPESERAGGDDRDLQQHPGLPHPHGGHADVQEVAGRVREVALGAYAHQDLPFEQLVTAIQPASERARMPLFQVNFRVQSDPVPPTLVPGVSLTFLKLSNQLAKFDLAIEFSEAASGITGFVEYRTDLFDAETIERLLSDLESILRTVTQNPDVALSSIELGLRPTAKAEPMSPADRRPDRGTAAGEAARDQGGQT